MQSVTGGDLLLAFDGAGLLKSIRRAGSGHQFMAEGADTSPWRLVLRDEAGHSRTVTARDARACRIEREGAELRFTWQEIAGADGIAVHVSLAPAEDGLAWRLAVDGLHGSAALWQADFPLLEGLGSIGEGNDERVLLPMRGGYVVRNAAGARLSPLEEGAASFFYPCDLTMQFVARYCEGGDGLMVMAQDAAGYTKRFSLRRVEAAGRGWSLAVEHFPEGMPQAAGRYSPSYAVVLTAFSGDWMDVAARYRAWATGQSWCARGPLHARGDIPAWLLENGLWVWNRGPSDKVLPGVRRVREMVAAPVALDWYWWHATPYDTHFPDYLPPREGAETFRQAVDGLHADRLRAMVYINGRLWGTSASSWRARGAEDAACKRESGDIYREVYNIFDPGQGEMTPMCPATSAWQATIRDLVDELLGRYRLDGVYLDQIAHTALELCHAPDHGHPTGGGNHWCSGYRTLMEGVRRARDAHPSAQRDAILPTEGSCEAYLDLFDAFLVLDNSFERMGFYDKVDLHWESVPLFAAVYHDYALQFGSYASLAPPPYDDLWPQPQGPVRSQRFHETDFADAFYAELGRAFVAGAQPMVSNVYLSELDDPALQDHWCFLREVVHARLHAAPFLVYGAWQRPPPLDVPEVEIDFLVRGIYTPPEGEHVIRRRLPAIMASSWAAPDGRLGLALANISPDSHPIALRVEDAFAGQPVHLIDGRGRIPFGHVANDGSAFEGAIPGRSVRVIEVGGIHG